MTTDPKTLLAGPLKLANVPNADGIANEQYQLLRSNHLLAEDGGRRAGKAKSSEPPKRCPNHGGGTWLEAGRCPTCEPRGD